MSARRRGVAAAFAFSALAFASLARAHEATASCAGAHSVFAPLPDGCLATIDTDRPHQTDTPHVVPAGHVQVESALAALAVGSLAGGARERGARLSLFDDNYKVGVVDGVDAQLAFRHASYATSERRFAPPGPYNFRVKLRLLVEDGAVPAVTLVPTIFVPVDPADSVRGGALLFWGWELPAGFELEVNAGALFGRAPRRSIAAVLAAAITKELALDLRAFVDVYATGPEVAFGTGLLLPVTRDLQLDAGTYVGIHGDEPVVTPFVGASIRR